MAKEHPNQTFWTPPRLELRAWFHRNAPSLGELYEGALVMIAASEFPGRTRLIAHAVREIRNRLPERIAGTKSGGYFDWKTRLDGLAKEWQKAGFSLDGTVPTEVTLSEGIRSPGILVEPQLFRKTAALLKDHIDGRERPEEAAFRMFEGIAPESEHVRDTLRPVVQQWIYVTDWFMKKTHDSGVRDNDVSLTEFVRHFELFETTLGALVRGFFKTIEGLDEILEDTNS